MVPGVQISKRLLAINSVGTVVRAVLSVSVLLWMHQHLIRRIPEEEYVLLPVLMAVIAVTPLLFTVLAGGLARFVTEAYARGDARRVTEITSTMAPLTLLAALLIAGIAALFTWKIDVVLEIAPSQVANAQAMLLILISGVVARLALTPFLLGFVVTQKFVLRDLIGLGCELLRLGLLVYLLTRHETRVVWVPVASLVSSMVEMLITLAVSRRVLPAARFDRSAIRFAVVRPIIGFGSWTVLGQVSRIVREMADPLILNRLAAPGDVVAFNLGAQVDRHTRRTIFGVISVMHPAATAMVATDQMKRLRRTWMRLCRYLGWVMLAIGIPFIVFREEFFALYLREKFAVNADAPVVLGLLVGRYVAVFPNAALGLVTTARGEVRESSLLALLMEVTNLALTLTLVGVFHMGAVGAALSSFAVALVAHPLLFWRLGLRLTATGFREWFRVSILPGCIPALAITPVWLLLRYAVEPRTWSALTACAVVGWIGYALVVYRLMGEEDRADLRKALRKVRGRST